MASRTLRCFIGAFVQANSSQRLQQRWRTVAPSVLSAGMRSTGRQVPLQNYHVTLKFLGNVDPAAAPELLALVKELGPLPTVAQVAAFTGFPAPDRARMAVAELSAHPQLSEWNRRLDELLGSEGRPFRPHVTLLRCRRTGRLAPLHVGDPLALALAPPRLYRSDQTPAGMRYRLVGLERATA